MQNQQNNSNDQLDKAAPLTDRTGRFLADDAAFESVREKVFSYSDFVSRSCTRYPDIYHDLIRSADLERSYPINEYEEKLRRALENVENEEELASILRKNRIREMIRIAWRDLSGEASLSETMFDLSAFADASVKLTLFHLHQWQCNRLGTPVDRHGKEQHLVVLGLGKLGAHELNFSSDIDLVFAYPEAGETTGGSKTIGNDEFFVRLGRRFINVMSEKTPDGIVFRVDVRLRPYGESGPLVMSFDAMESYFQRQGRDWERYAWIKARVIADESRVGDNLLKRLKPFVYRRYLDFGAFESLREMKNKISLDVKRKGLKDDIKLGPGGIREIEFFGQIFQLIRGGVTPVLQVRPIKKVLSLLYDEAFIPENVYKELTESYDFLRMIENRLQEFSDQQTHQLPVDDRQRDVLALSLGFDSWERFVGKLERCRQIVHFHFSNLLEAQDSQGEEEQAEQGFEEIWQGVLEDKDAAAKLAGAGFEQADDVIKLLSGFRKAFSIHSLGSEGKELVEKLIPRVLKEAGVSDQPHSVLNRILDLIKAVQKRTCYLSLLLENPSTLVHLVKLASAGPWIISFLSKHPVVLDELIDPRTLYVPPERSDLESQLRTRMNRLTTDDLEYLIEALCIFKQINMMRVAAADVTGALPLMRVSDYLTDIAETILHEVIRSAWDYLVERHGRPATGLDGESLEKGFIVAAYGKLGGIELSYGSDLDLVFLHGGVTGSTDGKQRPIDNSTFFTRLGQRVIHILSAHTPAGMLYETDMRLRPSGSSGILVSHIEAFKNYQQEKAWTWEHQAIVRARPISGDEKLKGYFNQIRKTVLSRPRSQADLQNEVKTMRERMRREHPNHDPDLFDLKHDPGGIVDIEFLVQYLVLLKSNRYEALMKWTDNVRILETLIETGILDDDTAHQLKEAYLTFRSAVHRLILQEKPATIPRDDFFDLQQAVKKNWSRFLEP